MRHRRRSRPPGTSSRRVASRLLPIENYPEFADLRNPAALSCVGRQSSGAEQRNDEAAAAFGSEGAYDPTVTRTALATFGAPVLLLGSEHPHLPR
jgi:hypothetical protein